MVNDKKARRTDMATTALTVLILLLIGILFLSINVLQIVRRILQFRRSRKLQQ